MTRATIEGLLGGTFFVVFIAADMIFGPIAAVRVAGVACIVCGLFWSIEGTVPVGIEGREPSFYLRGKLASVAGLAMFALGVVLLIYSGQVACVLGWSASLQCK